MVLNINISLVRMLSISATVFRPKGKNKERRVKVVKVKLILSPPRPPSLTPHKKK